MPGISLDYLCRDRAQTCTLDALSGSVLGIEVDHYLRKLIQQSRAPLSTPWSGVAQALFKTLDNDLATLKKLDIKPFFVFTGLQVLSQYDADPNVRLSSRTLALTGLERKRNDDTMQTFATLTTPSDLAPAFKDYLKANEVDFLVAPYFAGAQITYMLSVKLFDAVYSAADSLVYGAERVITDITFSSPTRVSFCDKAVVLGIQLQGFTQDQFLDAYLFSGNEFCSVVPILEPNPPSEFSASRMKAAADVVRQNFSGYRALNGNPMLESRPNYMEEWLKARILFKHHPYMNTDGDVVLLSQEKTPNDVARVLGARLPRELYFYMSRGLLDPKMIISMISGVWRETVPLDGGETREYRHLLAELNELRVQSLDLLHGSKQLHHYYEKRVVATDRWYQDDHSEEIQKLETPLYTELKKWRVDSAYINNHCKGRRDVESLLAALNDPQAVKASLGTGEDLLQTIEDVETSTMYRVLQVRGYVTSGHELSKWGKALLQGLKGVEQKMATTVVVAVEMLKLHAIKAEDFSTRFVPEAPEPDSMDAHWKLFERLGALLPLNQNDAPWQGPIDRDALVAFSMANTTRTYFANLYEMTRLSLLLRGEARRSPELIKRLSQTSNAFRVHYDAGMATYTRKYLLALSRTSNSSQINDELKLVFPTSRAGLADVAAVRDLWSALYRAVSSAGEHKIIDNTEQTKFDRTAEWLSSRT